MRIYPPSKLMTSSPRILALHASARLHGSHSRQLAEKTIQTLHALNGPGTVVVQDLAAHPLPHVDEVFTQAIFTPPSAQTEAQRKALAVSDLLVRQLQEAEVIVIDTPMYNLTVPSCLKAWIDHVVRPGLTFSFSPSGFKGLLQGKRAILVTTSGGLFSEGPRTGEDFLVPYLRQILGFIGIHDVRVIRAENLALDPEGGLAKALAEVDALAANIV